jgi:hypothetical protein
LNAKLPLLNALSKTIEMIYKKWVTKEKGLHAEIIKLHDQSSVQTFTTCAL